MRKFLTTVAFATALTFGAVATSSAAAPATGNLAIDAILLQYYSAVDTACTPAGDVAPDVNACAAALEAFAALADLDGILALPEIQALITAGTLDVAAVTAAVDSPTFADTFQVAVADLQTVIVTQNDAAFLAAIAPVTQSTLGFDTAAGPTEGSPTLVGG